MSSTTYEKFSGTNVKYFQLDEPFELQSGGCLPFLRIAYHTYGELSAKRDNVRWVCHALTASSDVADWWPGTVVEGGMLDPSRYFVVCANMIGSCYGSISPLDMDPFPMVTFRDMARAYALLADHLGVDKIGVMFGGSTGGNQALEWALVEPDRIEKLVLLATLPRTTAWIQASSSAQRMIIEASGRSDEGLAAARAVAMLQYRGPDAYNLTQTDPDSEKLSGYRVDSYQRYQGDKLARRFDVRCYLTLLDALDSFDLGRQRGGVEAALARINIHTLVIAVSTDIMYTPDEIFTMSDAMPRAEYHEISSPFGHDGFLVEIEKVTAIVD